MPTDFYPSLRNVSPSSFESREPLAILDFHIALFSFFGIICSEEFFILDNVTFRRKLILWNFWEIILLLIFLHKVLVFLSSLLQSPTWTCESLDEEVCRIKRGREKRCLIFMVFDILSNILPTLTLSVSCWHWPTWDRWKLFPPESWRKMEQGQQKTLSLWRCLSPGELPVFD